MITVPPELENVPATIVFEGISEDLTAGLRAEFTEDEDDVIYSHSFGGEGALLELKLDTLGNGDVDEAFAELSNLSCCFSNYVANSCANYLAYTGRKIRLAQ